jgi:hypothetical protein
MWNESEPALFQSSPSPDEDGLSVCSTAESGSAALSLSSHFSKIFLEESASFSGRNFRSRNSIIDWVSTNLVRVCHIQFYFFVAKNLMLMQVTSSHSINQALNFEVNIPTSPDKLSEPISHPADNPAFEPPSSAPILEFSESAEKIQTHKLCTTVISQVPMNHGKSRAEAQHSSTNWDW